MTTRTPSPSLTQAIEVHLLPHACACAQENLTGLEVGVRNCQGPHLEQIACVEVLRRAKPCLVRSHTASCFAFIRIIP